MNSMNKVKARPLATQKRSAGSGLCQFVLGDDFAELTSRGYTRLIDSPDIAAGVGAIADVIGSTTIMRLRNTKQGDQRVMDNLTRKLDIEPWSLGTRKSWIDWIVTSLYTSGDGNAFVLPVTSDGYLVDLSPMPGAMAVSDGAGSYWVQWCGMRFSPDEVLHFTLHADPVQPWRGRGLRVQLRDILANLRQSAKTTNGFLSSSWKPSVIVKVDALTEELSSPEGREQLANSYLKTQKAGEPWFVPADLMDVVQVKPLSLQDLAISSTTELDKRAVAAALGIPPFLLGVGAYNQNEYNNFIRRTVQPLSVSIAQELTKKLLYSTDQYFKFSTRKLYAYSLTELAKVGDDQYVRGIMTGNEVRNWLDLSPAKGLDDFIMLENYIPASEIGNQEKLSKEE